MNGYMWCLLVGAALGFWGGVKVGGVLALRRLVEFEYRTLMGRAGLRKK